MLGVYEISLSLGAPHDPKNAIKLIPTNNRPNKADAPFHSTG